MKHFASLVACFLLGTTMIFAQNKPVITFDKTTHDFGEVLESNGDVSCDFIVKNTGKAPLVLQNVTSTCGCTSPNWTKEPIEPGKTGVIKVTYGAKGRPGPISKTISVYSNAEDKPFVLSIKGSVKAAPTDPASTYPIAMGNLLMKNNVLNLGNIRNTEVRSTFIEVYNNGNTPITPVVENKVSYIKLRVEPATLAPNSKGMIYISIDGNEAKTYGTVENKFMVGYNGNFTNSTVTISTTFVDDFQKMTPEDQAKAPVLKVAQTSIDFGSVSSKTFKKTQQLQIKNEGKSDLAIRNTKVFSNVFSITNPKNKKVLKPGETVTLNVLVTGKVTENVTSNIEIISNDPLRSVYRLIVTVSN